MTINKFFPVTRTFKRRVRDALRMSAVGDAIGDKFEFKNCIDVSEVHDHIHDDCQIVITDDTQMTLFGFEAINDSMGSPFVEDIMFAYSDWYTTQTMQYSDTDVDAGRLLSEERMFARRAPGMTCLTSMHCILKGRVVENDSKGCGSVMRLLPFVSLISSMGYDAATELAVRSGYLTHKHIENEDAIRLYMAFALLCTNNSAMIGQGYLNHISKIYKYETIQNIGLGWTALECVEMAIWSVLHSDTLEQCMISSIAHDGDSDSVGAVACGLYGLSDRVTNSDTDLMNCLMSRLLESDIIEAMAQTI